MKRTLPALLTALLVCLPGALFAKGTPSGGHSSAHVSDQARLNSNGPNSMDRDKGQDRAEDRRSAQATAHMHVKHDKRAVVARTTATTTRTRPARTSPSTTGATVDVRRAQR